MTAVDHRTPVERPEPVALRPRRDTTRKDAPSALAILLIVHGVVHIRGVAAAFESLESGEPLEYLGGTWMVSNDLILGLIGTVWAALGLGFVLAAIAVLTEFRSWERPLVLLGVTSFAMCVMALWSAWIGLVVNAILIIVAIVSSSDRQISAGPPRMAI